MTDTTVQANRLRKNALGVGAITFMVVSAAAPLFGVAAAVPLAIGLGNGAGVPATFILCTLLMLIFAVGYVAMSRHVTNAGAFYAYCARGLGGSMGGGVSAVALVSYNAMQIGLLGYLGATANGMFGLMPWWAWSFLTILIVGLLGYRRVEISARVLVALVLLEYLIIFVMDFAILGKGGASGLSMNLFDMNAFWGGSLPVAILFCLGCFIGIEATTIYSEEARDPQKTIPQATYLSVLVIGLFFLFTAWLLLTGAGLGNAAALFAANPDPSAYTFTVATNYLPTSLVTLMQWLLLSSLFASVSAFHNYIARYTYVAGREGLLPGSLGVTHSVFQSPYRGTIVQSVCAIIVVGFFAVLGLDPVLNLFVWISQLGTLGVLGMMGMTSFAVIMYFQSNKADGNAFSTLIAPAIASIAMAVLFVYIFLHFADLTGTNGALAWILPALIPLAFIVGWLRANALKSSNPEKYAKLGQSV